MFQLHQGGWEQVMDEASVWSRWDKEARGWIGQQSSEQQESAWDVSERHQAGWEQVDG